MHAIVEQHRADVEALCRRLGARRLDLIGSAAREDFDLHRSDLDFVVEFEPLTPARYAEAFFELKEALESLFARPVDLITESSVENPYLRGRIESERQAVYAR